MAIRHDVVNHPSTADLIKTKARQLYRRTDFSTSDVDECEQEMHIYVWRKSHLYDPDRGSIEAFVTTALKSWVGMELRRRHRHKRWNGRPTVSIERTKIECGGDEISLSAILSECDGRRHTFCHGLTSLELLLQQEWVREGLSRLTAEEREILLHVAQHGVASAAREWSERLGFPFSRRQVGNEMLRIRGKSEDPRLSGQ